MKFLGITMFLSILPFISACSTVEDSTGNRPARITVQQASQMMKNENVMILDVRTAAEFAEGHIKNAILIPVNEIESRAADLITDKDQILLVYCRSGNRSNTAALALARMGFTAVYDFGGILDWDGDIVIPD